ncbi:MAG: ribosomal protein S18-alanine N-acetyltransferase [Armatimonadota bacterium]
MHEAADRALTEDVVIRRARPDDIDAVVEIEEESFPTPWSRSLLSSELDQPGSIYLVAEVGSDVVGFVGLWHVMDEGHICTLAVDPAQRGRGLGELLVLAALDAAVEVGSDAVHLEYRVSNDAAAQLYAKLGFERVGLRRGYYSDTGEDAVLARVRGLSGAEGEARLLEAWQRWENERSLRVAVE